jgi:outer membrane protein TolC
VVAQTTALTNAQTALDVKQSQLLAAVSLIEALGGGWDVRVLPDSAQVESPSTPAQSHAAVGSK